MLIMKQVANRTFSAADWTYTSTHKIYTLDCGGEPDFMTTFTFGVYTAQPCRLFVNLQGPILTPSVCHKFSTR
jgi:hypothetical protein